MREFDQNQKIALFAQVLIALLLALIIFVSYDYIFTNLPIDIFFISRNIFIVLFSINLLIIFLQYFRYKKSGLYRLEKIVRHSKKNHITFDRIVYKNGTASFFKGEQKVLEVET